MILPLRKRIAKTLFFMMREAHRSMWPPGLTPPNGGDSPPTPVTIPSLADLMPRVSMLRQLPLELCSIGVESAVTS